MQTVFTLMDKKEDINEFSYSIELANESHQLFMAHFGILAGFLQIDIVASLMAHNIKKIVRAKFLSPLRPKDRVYIAVSSSDYKRYKAVLKDFKEKKVSEFIYEI